VAKKGISLKKSPDLLEFRALKITAIGQANAQKKKTNELVGQRSPEDRLFISQKRASDIMAGAADFKQLKFEQEEKKAEIEASKIARGGSVYFLCMALVAMYVWILRQRSNKEHVAKKVETLGRASLEGKFDLVQTKDGEEFSTDDLLGKWSLIYFGFTRCPDVCPEQLEKMAYVIQSIEETKKNPKSEMSDVDIVPLFISIDVRRDTFEEINEYCESFHPSLIGLSGTEKQVDAAAKSFRLYFSKGMYGESDEDYLLDHTVVIFLLNPENKIEEYFTQSKSPGQIIFETHQAIKKWKFLDDFIEVARQIEAKKEEVQKKRLKKALSKE